MQRPTAPSSAAGSVGTAAAGCLKCFRPRRECQKWSIARLIVRPATPVQGLFCARSEHSPRPPAISQLCGELLRAPRR